MHHHSCSRRKGSNLASARPTDSHPKAHITFIACDTMSKFLHLGFISLKVRITVLFPDLFVGVDHFSCSRASFVSIDGVLGSIIGEWSTVVTGVVSHLLCQGELQD